MRDLVFRLYRSENFTDADLPLFIKAGYISAADYQELTGHEYREV